MRNNRQDSIGRNPCMFSVYLGLILLWIFFLIFVLREQYYFSFILPGQTKLYAPINREVKIESKTNEIIDYYQSVISQLVAQKYCMNLFGKDITSIIMGLCGGGDYEFGENADERYAKHLAL